MSGDSWSAFVEALRREAAQLARLEAESLALTKALVGRELSEIEALAGRIERARLAHQAAWRERQAMQRRGFGEMPLGRVVGYAPRRLALRARGYYSELRYRAISLSITTKNNKRLIVAGMDRLLRVVSLLQRATADRPGTYKRRGFVAPPDNSVLVSSKA